VDSPAESSRDVRDMCVRYRTLTAQVASSLARSLANASSLFSTLASAGWLSRRNRSQIVLEYENGRAMVVRTDAAIARVGGISPGTEVHLTRYIELGQGFLTYSLLRVLSGIHASLASAVVRAACFNPDQR